VEVGTLADGCWRQSSSTLRLLLPLPGASGAEAVVVVAVAVAVAATGPVGRVGSTSPSRWTAYQ